MSKRNYPFLNGRKSARSKNGFTLIESLVVSGIIVMMLVLALPDFRAGQGQFALRRSAGKLAQDLRKTQELSMSAAQFSCPVPKKMAGYGIYFQSAAPNNVSYSLQAKCVDGSDSFIEKEKIVLEKDVKIKELRKDGAPVSSLNVFFYPPDPKVDLAGANEVEIILFLEKDIVVKINKAGLINVE